MNSDFADLVKMIQAERGITEDLVLATIEEFLIAAYKKTFGTSENAVVKFLGPEGGVSIFAKKVIVEDDDLYNPVTEIELSNALDLNEDCEVGDELLIEIDPKDFDRGAVQSAKQKARQSLRVIQKDTLYSEFKDKVGEMIIGYFQREKNGTIFVDLGKTEGILPRRFQSPREEYHHGDRIKAMIAEVKKGLTGLEIILSRSHGEFVKRIFELEVPEIYDGTVEIFKIVREPGFRTKVAVYSTREDVDPVGACVGLKGVRIQSIVRELEGEKIDILKYDSDPVVFIKNALSSAEVQGVIILDGRKRQALVIVPEQQLSLAIGKQGLNVRLANRLVDWNIDVKTEAQFSEMDISKEASRVASDLFSGIDSGDEEITKISELPDISDRLVSVLKENGIELIETLVNLTAEELEGLTGLTLSDVEQIRKIIDDNVEIIEEGENEVTQTKEVVDKTGGEEADTYECPDCKQAITADMSTCPNCGVGLSFVVEEVEEQENS
ncbi:Transcription termination protein NusA [Olavius algarvensis spirochete endosymbiont]|uniref:transcription termination factor NusA n=1 Tax=Olavius algarvensis spirochete endosymbiont TaxID=260710 RepID=UPI00052D5C48|nr:transcription termination factor NusA [Olavius algarvensis spirochete endosymbiont]KGM44391.1 transcription elongation factor NusA [Alkalispirochaeta odontotermitis]CAD7837627.1 MAG: Transcription termination protein NusA [Olavius algarvensis spirochete endosymbiont]VDA99821.1 Transcription termination protein NusA [Olavius algarvensis spirochete endosymbiont]